MKKILVTGGAGFIGSNLCLELSKKPNNCVYSLDNYFTGSELNHVKNVKYIKGIFGSGKWEVEGETSSGKFKVSYEKNEQHLKHAGAKCLNWREVTF